MTREDKNSLSLSDIDNVLNADEHIRQVNSDSGIDPEKQFNDVFDEHAGAC
jgi:hypothetical protein